MLARGPATYATPGVRFCLDVADSALRATVLSLLAPLRAGNGSPPDVLYRLTRGPGGCSLSVDGALVARSLDDDTVVAALVWDLHQRTAIGARHLLRLHAAAVRAPAGAVMAVGPSGAGKSTLCAALVRRGMGYLTDDLACIEPTTLSVVPYPKPLALQTDRGERLVAPHDLGGTVGDAGAVLLVLLIGHAPGQRTESHRLRPVDAMARLIPHTCGLDDDPGGALNALNDLVHKVPCLLLRSGRPAAAAEAAARAVADTVSAPAV